MNIPQGAELLAWIMHAPEEAFSLTAACICVCGVGFIIIVTYNLLSAFI